MRGDPDRREPLGRSALGRRGGVRLRGEPRFTTELHGEIPADDGVVVAPGALVGVDGSGSPILTELDSRVNAAAGLTWQHPSGVLLGVGMNYRIGLEGQSAVGLQLRMGFHSGVRIFSPPPPVPLPAPRRVEAAPPPAPKPVVEAPKPAPPRLLRQTARPQSGRSVTHVASRWASR